MHPVTLKAFEDELASISKEAGIKDFLKRGTKPLSEKYTQLGQKAAIASDNLLDKAKKLPVVGKRVNEVNLPDIITSVTNAI